MESHADAIPLTRQMCASFDAYVNSLALIFSKHKVDVTRFVPEGCRNLKLEFVGATVEAPKFLEADGTSHKVNPKECLERNLTYSVPVYSDVHVTGVKSYVIKSVFMGKIPLMLGSRYDPYEGGCEYDPKGYFIINGSEKSIVLQKAHVHNTCLTLKRKVNTGESFAICCKSEGNEKVSVTTIKWNGKAYVNFPKLKNDITVGTLLSILPESHFVELSAEEREFYKESLEERSEINLQDTFLLGETDEDRHAALLEYCLPHTKHKSDYVRIMLKQLYRDMHAGAASDKDALMFQRIEMVHDLLTSLTHHLMRKTTHTLRQFLHRKLTGNVQRKTIEKLLGRTTILSDGLSFALSTGNWNTQSFDSRQRVGVAQLLQKNVLHTAISQLRRVSSSIKPEQKLSKPRFLHGQHRGRLCFIETPEGAACGLETQLTIGAYVSISSPEEHLRDFTSGMSGDLLVFLNGAILGFGSEEVALTIREARRTGQISKDVSVTVNDPTVCVPNICIRTNSGRICRPLYICPRREDKSFTEMLSEGIVEYLDVYEESTMLVRPGGTHEEIDPSMTLGFCAALTPYSDRNPAPRNTYQAAMIKQAQGVNSLEFGIRFDTTTNVMHYGQTPLVSTRVERAYKHNLPVGQNAIVAIMSFKYNQEDSIIFCKGSIDRGMGRCTQLKTVKDSLCSDEVYTEFPKINQLVKKGDVLIGKKKCGYTRVGKKRIPYENDTSVLSPHDAIVDKILVYKERNGSDACKVRLRKPRIPCIGGKWASRSAQKGTIGLVVPQEDMPFTLDGITPDIILNPHAIPSRMTCGHILECLKSKYGCYAGLQDGSPFNGDSAEDIMAGLKSMGFKSNGEQIMFSGITGERFKVPIYIGPTFYQRLKHNSEDKLHARARGRKDFLTRQPNEGRANGGALRLGEMEKDALIAHSVPSVLVERLMHSSDLYEMQVCSCGRTHSIRAGVCNRCNASTSTMQVPYAFKLLMQELQSMCIDVRLT